MKQMETHNRSENVVVHGSPCVLKPLILVLTGLPTSNCSRQAQFYVVALRTGLDFIQEKRGLMLCLRATQVGRIGARK
jgi:hypothetical protein